MKKLKVIELFAGVGGFRLGLEGYEGKSATSNYSKPFTSGFEVVWSNQFEPSTKSIQHASEVYTSRWPKCNHSNEDIEQVIEHKFDTIPDHDVLVGGFPCQDYSVATTLKSSKGLEGTKGVLWWSIYNILKKKGAKKSKYLILENVDRLLISPSKQRGRDFAVMLSCLNSLGYAVEWRVVNAADYGMPQRRRRVFIVAYHKTTSLYKKMKVIAPQKLIVDQGVFAKAFLVKDISPFVVEGEIAEDVAQVSEQFNVGKKLSPFLNSGFMIDGRFYSSKLKASYSGDSLTLGEVLEPLKSVDTSFYITDKLLKEPLVKPQIDGTVKTITTEKEKWAYLKGSKKELKTNATLGYQYKYAEGRMVYPEDLEKPSRTIITGEGGSSASRFKHVVLQDGVERRLTPVELERLNMFPDNHTAHEKVNDNKRAFLMGNALVVGVVEMIAQQLKTHITS